MNQFERMPPQSSVVGCIFRPPGLYRFHQVPSQDTQMRPRTTKSLTISLPPGMVADLDRIRLRERRTRSELLREALRHYMAIADTGQAMPEADAQKGEINAIRRGREDFARGETISLEALQNELGLPTR
jgi:predicted transcriptional regulator